MINTSLTNVNLWQGRPFEGNLNSHQLNAKQAKGIRAKLAQTYPKLEEEHLEQMWPKKTQV